MSRSYSFKSHRMHTSSSLSHWVFNAQQCPWQGSSTFTRFVFVLRVSLGEDGGRKCHKFGTQLCLFLHLKGCTRSTPSPLWEYAYNESGRKQWAFRGRVVSECLFNHRHTHNDSAVKFPRREPSLPVCQTVSRYCVWHSVRVSSSVLLCESMYMCLWL